MNTNAKHTPGPWIVASQDTETNEIPIKCGKSILARVAPRPHWDATQEANARLIAAAPDLLFALYACLAELVDVVNAEGGDESEAMRQARAAILQAEGGAQ